MAPPPKKSVKKNARDTLKPRKMIKHKPKDAVQSKALNLQIEDDIPDFPRGGRSVLSRREEEEVRAQVDAEFEANERLLKKKKKSKMSHTTEEDLGSLFADGIIGKLPRFANRITLKAADDHNVEDPLSKFKIGQVLTARIVSKANEVEKSRKNYQWELSIRPNTLLGSSEFHKGLTMEDCNVIGKQISGYVVKIEKEWVLLTVSRHVKAQLFILDSSCEPSELQEFQKRFPVGKAVTAYILSINQEKKLLRLTLRQPIVSNGEVGNKIDKMNHISSIVSNENITENVHEGDTLGGRLIKILPDVGGLRVQIAPHLYGKVHYTELKDKWVDDPLFGYEEGQFVKCKVLEISHSVNGSVYVDLSLRSSLEDAEFLNTVGPDNNVDSTCKRVTKIEGLRPNMAVQGYVKNVTPKGCFIMLSRKLDAKILLSNLSDGFVEKPEKDFPVGKLVNGKVLSMEPLSKRVEVTLKTRNASGASIADIVELSKVNVGDVISGRIKRVESFGLFIMIDDTNLVGLCHVSELSDDNIDNIESKYKAGQRVVTKILKVDKERHRISLGMKKSYLRDDTSLNTLSGQETDGNFGGNVVFDDSQITEDEDAKISDIECPTLAHAESRASILPLEVNLEEMEGSDLDNVASTSQEQIDEADKVAEKNKRRARRKEKEEREQEIRVAEERLLEKDIPRTADEFEKLVRSSPNSSFVWIKYMAFMLSLADIEKARSVAERALQTINIREDAEKLNIWVAFFNLENEYGNPPEEAVMKTFHRALQVCDPKKVHLALLGMYERTEQHKLVDELFEKMTKKFKHSCKIWLRRVQSVLKPQKDGIQSIVNRALLSLPRHKHIKFISQSAILEFKCGLLERGRSMFEGILREYPKRTDLWSIYLDQEIRIGDMEVIRALFERATSLTLPPKKMKFLFKKYLEYEKCSGDEERIEYVKRKAMEYVESSLA